MQDRPVGWQSCGHCHAPLTDPPILPLNSRPCVRSTGRASPRARASRRCGPPSAAGLLSRTTPCPPRSPSARCPPPSCASCARSMCCARRRRRAPRSRCRATHPRSRCRATHPWQARRARRARRQRRRRRRRTQRRSSSTATAASCHPATATEARAQVLLSTTEGLVLLSTRA